ncbi:coiled-coil domain-containing protein 97 [Polistes fuscatus]|uniref:coiled-coil domain-containing protein 97 n=1 Tax=Polistes fuscatus TaxID=30207 RepID=UPI001CA9E685|nr:coiled-coil domain-containing protein 97 [Polistes fuscatus]
MLMEKQVSSIEQNLMKTMTEVKNNLENELLNYLAGSDANFKSQQKDDPELTFEEKRTIASDLLKKSYCLFLAKFGHYLNEEYLKYFDSVKDENYEISYHINRLRRHFNNSIRQRDIKNRRYEALKKLIEEGEYFSESEMMKRNPLLYEHLVGQYLTQKQKETRDNIDMKNITFVHLLMESIERNWVKEREKLQKEEEEEDNVIEENDSDDTNESSLPKQSNLETEPIKSWGEFTDVPVKQEQKTKTKQTDKSVQQISNKEKQILKEEFVTHMYQSFLEGKDPDFDYSVVDNNEAYDNVDLRTQDEEEKYFDSESPETIIPENSIAQNESEDELDAYMRSLKEQTSSNTHSVDNET